MTRSERRYRSISGGALWLRHSGCFCAALATEVAEQARERIAVEGNRRVDTETVPLERDASSTGLVESTNKPLAARSS